MNSFILFSRNITDQATYLKQFATKQSISPFDQMEVTEGIQASIGIETIRKIHPSLFLSPFKSKAKMLVFKNAENLTIEAQNALLKILEEPPEYLFIFLCTSSEDVLLPTILSRCQIIKLAELTEKKEESKSVEIATDIAILTAGSINEKLLLAEKLAADKEHLTAWFKEITQVLRENMYSEIQQHSRNTFRILTTLQEGHKTFQTTNVSPRIILEHTFLQLTYMPYCRSFSF